MKGLPSGGLPLHAPPASHAPDLSPSISARTTRLGIGAAGLVALILLSFQLYANHQAERAVRYRDVARLSRNLIAPSLLRYSSAADSMIASERQLDSLIHVSAGLMPVEALVALAQRQPSARSSALRRITLVADERYRRAVQAGWVARAVETTLVGLATLLLLVVLLRLRRMTFAQSSLAMAQRSALAEQNLALRRRGAEVEQRDAALATLMERVQAQALAQEEQARDLHAATLQLAQSRDALGETAREQAALLEAMTDVVVVLDRDGQYLKVGRVVALPGLPEPSVRVGRTVHEVLPAAAADRIVHIVREALDSRRPYHGEYAIALPGRTTWFDATAVPLDRGRVMFVGRDVTPRKADETALREREERYRLLARATNEVVFEADLASWQITFNDRLRAALGYDPAGIDRQAGWWMNRIHPADVTRVRAAFDGALRGDGELVTAEFRIRRGDDRFATVLARAFIQRDERGQPRRMIGSMLDLTERHAIEDKLRQSQKMEAVGQLAGGVAHDFNNLLTVIISYASMTLENSALDAEDREALDQILIAARRAGDLTRELLTFSRHRVYEERVVDVNAMVLETSKLLGRLLPVDIDFVTHLATDCGAVKADPQQLTQILMNLALNARDAMPDGGTLAVETSRQVLHDPLCLPRTEVPPGAWAVITVSDAGIGMPAHVQEHMFEPFFTTKPAGSGTGLGLATVYGIVNQFGGRIAVFSEPDIGTTFRIFLPAAEPARESAREPTTVARVVAPPPAASATILVVDDDASVRRVIARTLHDAGYRVREAEDGFDALAILDSLDTPPDLIVSDLVMPRVGGQALRDEIAARTLPVRVLLMTGYSSGRLDEAQWPQGEAFMEKPFLPGALLARVRELLDDPVRVPAPVGEPA